MILSGSYESLWWHQYYIQSIIKEKHGILLVETVDFRSLIKISMMMLHGLISSAIFVPNNITVLC